jgi:parvulin-like peptidyl-prolyl isomerase
MKHAVKKIFSVLAAFALVLVIFIAVFTAWFYASPPSVFKDKVAEIFPYPAALVNGQPIAFRDILARQAVSSSTPDAILAEIISEQQTQIVAEKYGLGVGNAQLNSEMSRLEQQSDFTSLLADYGLTENNFKNSVLKPQLLYNNLELWFNGQRSLNTAAYALADNIQRQMAQNAASGTFASLVAQYSQDASTKALDGNLGFVEINSLRPEFQGAVESAGPGAVVVAPGSDGLYIFQIQAKDSSGPGNSPRAELAEIYLHGGDFQAWYDNETKNIKIKKLI